MRCRAVALLTLLTLLLAPLASAQVPDPGEAVVLACATVGGASPDARDAIPLCPQPEPAAPAAEEDDHQHTPATPEPAEGAAAVAEEAQRAADGIADDPASAPDRLVALAASVRQFVEDLLGLPAAGVELGVRGVANVGEEIAQATQAAGARFVAAGEMASSAGSGIARAAQGVSSTITTAAGDAWRAVADVWTGRSARGIAEARGDGPAADLVDEPRLGGLADLVDSVVRA